MSSPDHKVPDYQYINPAMQARKQRMKAILKQIENRKTMSKQAFYRYVTETFGLSIPKANEYLKQLNDIGCVRIERRKDGLEHIFYVKGADES